jgi:acyl carrier protein
MYEGGAPAPEARVFGIVTQLLTKRNLKYRLSPEQPLYDAGLSSLDMVSLMLAVEAEFDCEIPQQYMTLENFRSVATISRLVALLAPA